MSNIDPLNTDNPRKRRLPKITASQVAEFALACGMSGLPVHHSSAEQVLMIIESMKRYGGDFDLYTACRIKAFIVSKYSPKKKRK